MTRSRSVFAFVGAAVAALFVVAPALADGDVVLPDTHQYFNIQGDLSTAADGGVDASAFRNVSGPICTTPATNAANVNTNCEAAGGPSNETAIAVDPNNPSHIVGSANDYQLVSSSGGYVIETIYTRSHVSTDGGKSWTEAGIQFPNYTSTGDPATAFDAKGRVYEATLGFSWSQANFCCTSPDILAAVSNDGGFNWTKPTRVMSGTGVFGGPGTLNDKEEIAAWGDGNAIVTWTVFNQGFKGSYISSPIYDSVTHDAGSTWSAPQEISGSAPFCVGAGGGTACNQATGSVPVVAADGSIYVSFIQTANTVNFRDEYAVVKVDPATGARVAGPYKIADVFDGVSDYPINIDGRQTYQDSQFRTWAFGPIAADPTNAKHLGMAWSDMRNSQLPAPRNPYTAKTNSDVIVSESFDGGATWTAAKALAAPGDQFQPWATFDTSGRFRVSYFDRSYDSANHLFGYTLATETKPGSLKFTYGQVTTALSDPTKNDRWSSGVTVNSAYPHPTRFIGDYSGIAASPTGGVVMLWTDLRDNVCFTTRCGHAAHAYYGASA